MKISDCDAAYGRAGAPLPRELETVADLAAELTHCGIEEALVWHRDALERGFEAGNARLAELAPHPNLHGSFTFVPTCNDEMPPAPEFLQQLQKNGVRAVRAFPTTHCFLLDYVSCGDLLELLVAYKAPLFVPLGEFDGQWQGVYRLMRDFPHLTLVVTQSGCWGQDRYFRPLMKAYPRFHISMNRIETAGQVKSIVDKLGPNRLLFGSGLPFNNPGGYALSVARSEIPEAAKKAILSENLERIMKEVAW